MSRELIINASLPETRIVLLEDGEIQELLIERASGRGIVGNIYKGRVTRVLPGMQAAFVDIGLDKAAFLYVDDVYVHPAAFGEEGERHSHSHEDHSEDHGGETPDEIQAAEDSQAADEAQVAGENPEEEAGSPDEAAEPTDEPSEDPNFEPPTESETDPDDEGGDPVAMGADDEGSAPPAGTVGEAKGGRGARGRRGRRGGRRRGRGGPGGPGGPRHAQAQDQSTAEKPASEENADAPVDNPSPDLYPETFLSKVNDQGDLESDRSALTANEEGMDPKAASTRSPRSELERKGLDAHGNKVSVRKEFREPRGRDRRIHSRQPARTVREQVNIQDLLQEGQEVIVQVAKEPIAAKGARLTCHISLPGRHLVCMPTIDHVGVSRRIEREDERRRLRDFVEKHRPRKMGFIVRTASGGKDPETWIAQDIEYLARIWNEIREKALAVSAPAMIYEDLTPILRAIRDWVNQDVDKIIVDSRYHFNEIKEFAQRFMPSLEPKVELYHGDIPIFDAYGISTELHRSLERKVWLKSGGYLVIDQAEALVAIDVNTGRYVGKKNLEDTILKTNLEAVNEIAYQLRLRNCGGIIILDLIDMEKEENKHRVYRALEEALKKDRSRPTILKISELGLVEMTRKRTRDTIVRALCEPCQHCEGKGFMKSKQTVAYELLREIEREGIDRESRKILITAHPDVIDILAIDERDTLDTLEKRYRKQIYLQASEDFHPEQYEIIGEKSHQKQVYVPRIVGRDSDRDRSRGRGGRDRNRDRNSSTSAGHGESGDDSRRPKGRGGSHSGSHRSGPPVLPLETPIVTPVQSNPEAAPVAIAPRPTGSQGPTDEDSLGNRADYAPSNDDSGMAAPIAHDFDSEEDRLAFLRAQAAQDAALAGVSTGGSGNQQGRAGGGFRGGHPRGGQPKNNGGRHGKGGGGGGGGRGGRNRHRRGPGGPGGGGGGGGRFQQSSGPRPYGGGPAVNAPSRDVFQEPAAAAAPPSGGNGDSDPDRTPIG